MAHRDSEQQAAFDAALQALGTEETLTLEQLGHVSALQPEDLPIVLEKVNSLVAPARVRAMRMLHAAALEHKRLDFSALNQALLTDADDDVRLAAIEAGLEDTSRALLDRLLEMLANDPSPSVRRAAAVDLGRFVLVAELDGYDATTAERLRTALLNVVKNDAIAQEIRQVALGSLGFLSQPAIGELISTSFSVPTLRVGAIVAMGNSADARWTERLLPLLESDDDDERVATIYALREIEDERAIAPLVDLVDDSETDVRIAAIRALGTLGGEEAREALLYAAQDEDPAVSQAADAALTEIEDAEGDPLDV